MTFFIRLSKVLKAGLLLPFLLSGCQITGQRFFSDIDLRPTIKKSNFPQKETIENLLYEIWTSGFFKPNDFVKQEILNNTYGLFRKGGKSSSASNGRAYFQIKDRQNDILMLNFELFGRLEPRPMGRVSIISLDRRIQSTIVHELFHDIWYNLLDERKRYLFSCEAEIFFNELILAKTEKDKQNFLKNVGINHSDEDYFSRLTKLLEATTQYSHEKVFGTELYAILAGLAYSGKIHIPRQFRSTYYGILADEVLNRSEDFPSKNRFPGSNNETGFKSLHQAAYSGNTEAVRQLIQEGADVNVAATSCAWTPFLMASLRGHLDTAQLLVRNGAPTDIKDSKGRTALHLAAKRGHKEFIEFLLQNGLDLNVTDEVGMTPLHTAAYSGQRETVALLLAEGADVRVTDIAGQTPLHLAAMNGNKDIAGMLIVKGANLNAKDYKRETALHIAAFSGHKRIIELLIESGANLDIINYKRLTSLAIASRAGHEKIVDRLLQAGARPETGKE